jgi:diguanylate cyclase (GGDEF)-like protein/PAS domain S-box-containing protein
MNLNTNMVYAALLVTSAVVAAFISGVILRRRSAPGAAFLFLFLIGVQIWSLTYAMHWLSTRAEDRLFWLDATYLGVVIAPTAMLIFILRFTRPSNYFRGWKLSWLALEPFLTLLILWSDPWHGWFYGGGPRFPEQNLIFDGGPWFWLHVFYTYGLIAAGIGLLVSASAQRSPLNSHPARLVLAGVLFPVASNVIVFAGLNPFPGLDLTPIAFTFTGVLLGFSLFYQRLLDLTTLGRDVLIEKMNEGILLLDQRQRIVDFNPALQRLLALPKDNLLGETIDEVLGMRVQAKILSALLIEKDASAEIEVHADTRRAVQVQASPVHDLASGFTGWLIICFDITKQREAERELEARLRQIEALQANLREQAIRDPLTGLFNRRYLQETLPRELARAEREGRPLSVSMLDLDHFKQLNDTYGHLAGDAMLQQLAKVLTQLTRSSDILVRYGGEEFIVVLPDSTPQIACQRAEEWRAAFEQVTANAAQPLQRITLSVGIASYPRDGTSAEELIHQADMALYRAKSGGRNQVATAEPPQDRR